MSAQASSIVHIEPSMQGSRAWGMRFDKDANVIAETESRQYIGYTRAEIRRIIRAELLEQVTR